MKNIKGKSFVLTICVIAFCATAFKSGCFVGKNADPIAFGWLYGLFGLRSVARPQ